MTLTEIILACKKNDPKGQRALVDHFATTLMTVGRRYAISHYDEKDIVQDAFINVFKAINQYDDQRGSFEGWIRRITINTALGQLRKKNMITTQLSQNEIEITTLEPDVYQKLGAEELMKMIRQLPEKYRFVFNLSCIEGYSHKEIGELLGIEEASSRSNLSRAKSILRKKILQQKNETSWVKTG